MSKRTETNGQVIIRSGNKTDVWNKNSAGNTTYGGHYTDWKSGNRTNHYGRTIKK